MKMLLLLVIIKIIIVVVDSSELSNSTTQHQSTTIKTTLQNENVESAISSKNVSKETTTARVSTIPSTISSSTTSPSSVTPSLSSSSSSDPWKLTKILAKKGVNLRNHADKSIQIACPPDGDFLTFIRDSSFWIDKSLLIRRIFEGLWDYNVVSTAPPKWGKTINLSMLKFYCELPVDSDGFEIPKNQTASHLYFNEGKVVSRDGTIEELDGVPLINGYEEHLASHPVIHISGANITGDGTESFRRLLHEAYKRHASVLTRLRRKMSTSDPEQIASAARDMSEFLAFYDQHQVSKLNSVQLRFGLQNLTRILYAIYKRKVVVLMDDFDDYVHSAFFDTEPSNFSANSDQFATIWETTMRFTFKHNHYIEKGILTGVLKARDPASLLEFNKNYGAYVFDDLNLFPFYGIFENEFRQMASKRGINQSLCDMATQWYGGYRTISHPDLELYSPYSVTRFLSTLQIQNYSQRSRLTEFVLRLIRKKDLQRRIPSMIQSFDNNTIHLSFMYPRNFKKIDWKEYEIIEGIERDTIKLDAHNEDLVFAILVCTGYAAVYEYNRVTGFIVIKIPNVEIRNNIYAAIKDL